MISQVFIYALLDPDSGRVRYIGKSYDPKIRFKAHVGVAQNSPLGEWICALKEHGKRPYLEVLESVSSVNWSGIELDYIKVFRLIWPDLLNQTGGVPKKMTQNRVKCPRWVIK